ncbi:MFS transporter [Primorskyibacter flagellatus]|uniref:MFS-type transporter involved in bile tolerance, Atg22 family n=1 Tax=Primorskyibacter flagellatus TaxID=1387277 RepID=A0A1W2BL80_9RHOB|nr:MFS transporter [Primorskyibacter flagellatus]SMC73596.1 MFS-type transporter involved in bile tolerance, Atg22 family [Primorskyibacter flagellatus]
MAEHQEGAVFQALTGSKAKADQRDARNGLRHMAALSMTKVADGLIDPKLVLSWLLNAIGAPAYLTGLLVPIREAGALLPQLALAGWVRRMKYRKWAWIAGSAGQGVSAAGIALAALTLQGAAAGLVICGLLAVLAVSRACASVSYKDVLGKTVAKTRRGAVTGVAGSASAVGVVVFALLLMSGWLQSVSALAVAVGLAACLWLGAALLFSTLKEDASEDGDAPAIDLSPLREDAQFRRYILVRGALTATALAPPYLVLLSGGDGSALGKLGALVLASAAASFVSSYVWGRLSDRSSRWVLALCGFGGALAIGAAPLAAWAGVAQSQFVIPAILFALMLAYHGVRQGRSTYLVDMSPEDERSTYAALANTVIGVLLLISGALGGGLSLLGPVAALCGFAALSAVGGMLALGLREVEST